ncbi:MAG: YeeE/YedE thiosulfate transporter family protein [Methanomicrobiales archaeon]|nr:YeeE/YedE thiosulfate transporter family protein [Methanomicrobiales archaeon]
MLEWFTVARWSPYIAGAGIGILIWTTFLLSDRPLGASTAYAKTAGIMESAIFGKRVKSMPYYRLFSPKFDWQWMIVAGVVIGAFISSYLSGTFGLLLVPPLFAESFGANVVLRASVALFGGILMGLGARWAGGCTSGHGISGTLQLSIASWVAAACFFAGGILIAGLMFGFRFI